MIYNVRFVSCIVLFAFRLAFEYKAFANFNDFKVRTEISYVQILHIGGQMDILRSWLTDFASNENGKKRTSSTRNEIIEKHQRIINFSEKVENLYTYIALLQFASNTIMICSLAFLIVGVSKELKLKYCSQCVDKITVIYRIFAND